MISHCKISEQELRKSIKAGKICFGGNRKLKIYGTLYCKAGKRMKRENRVFFHSAEEARREGFRPCGHCLREAYNNWKSGFI